MKKQIVFLLAMTLVGLQSDAIAASRCFKPVSVSDELKRSTAVFSGMAIAEEYRPINSEQMPKESKRLVIRFAVEHWWKGFNDAEVVLDTSVVRHPDGITSFMDEDFTFRIGEKYLVYAYFFEGHLRTDGCRRTKKLAEAEEDLRKLGQGKSPERTNDHKQDEKSREATKPTKIDLRKKNF